MTPQEKRICEIAYNLSQAFLKAKRSGQNETLLSITGVIYGFNQTFSVRDDYSEYQLKNLYRGCIGI